MHKNSFDLVYIVYFFDEGNPVELSPILLTPPMLVYKRIIHYTKCYSATDESAIFMTFCHSKCLLLLQHKVQ